MPTAKPIPPMPADLFGELGAFFVDEHTESMQLGAVQLRIRTSGNQTDDRERGTWHVSLCMGPAVLMQTQIAWCPPEQARASALAWAIAAGFKPSAEPVSTEIEDLPEEPEPEPEPIGSESTTVREPVATLLESVDP